MVVLEEQTERSGRRKSTSQARSVVHVVVDVRQLLAGAGVSSTNGSGRQREGPHLAGGSGQVHIWRLRLVRWVRR